MIIQVLILLPAMTLCDLEDAASILLSCNFEAKPELQQPCNFTTISCFDMEVLKVST